MGNTITPESRFVWLVLARNGGWWTVKALEHYLRPTFVAFELQEILDGLLPARYVTARQMMPGEPLSYAFTSECVPLPSANLGEPPMLEAA